MSYDTWMEIDTGGEFPARVVDSINSTSNHSPIWAAALGFHFRELEGKTGIEAAPLLEKAIAFLEDLNNRKDLRALEPGNGWGSLEHATQYLRDIRAWCKEHPKATIGMSY